MGSVIQTQIAADCAALLLCRATGHMCGAHTKKSTVQPVITITLLAAFPAAVSSFRESERTPVETLPAWLQIAAS